MLTKYVYTIIVLFINPTWPIKTCLNESKEEGQLPVDNFSAVVEREFEATLCIRYRYS